MGSGGRGEGLLFFCLQVVVFLFFFVGRGGWGGVGGEAIIHVFFVSFFVAFLFVFLGFGWGGGRGAGGGGSFVLLFQSRRDWFFFLGGY